MSSVVAEAKSESIEFQRGIAREETEFVVVPLYRYCLQLHVVPSGVHSRVDELVGRNHYWLCKIL